MRRFIYLATVVLALPVFLCAASPAIRELQQQVDVLQTQTDSLQAQMDRLPIVVDGAGEILGDVVDGTGAGPVSWTGASVLFDLPGLPLFSLWVVPEGLTTYGVTLWFESEDCTGQAWIEAADARGIMGTVFGVPGSVPLPPTGRTFYVADPFGQPGDDLSSLLGCECWGL